MDQNLIQHPGPIIGKKAPHFSTQGYFQGDFQEYSLDQYKGKYLILFFYPMDFTFVCPTEIISFSDASVELEKSNCQILGCSIDTKFVHMRWCTTPKKQGGLGEIKIPLLTDVNKEMSQAYRCLITEGEERGVALRATFIIDTNGILRHMSYNDLPIGRNVDEYIRLVNAIKFTDENGEVCPAKWKKKGDATMKPNHNDEKTKKYFEDNQNFQNKFLFFSIFYCKKI